MPRSNGCKPRQPVRNISSTTISVRESRGGIFLLFFSRLTTTRGSFPVYKSTKEADAEYYTKKKQAEAMQEIAKAYGSLAQVMGGPQGLLQYLMLQDKTYEKLAMANAQAIQGLQPKITVWNTGKRSFVPFFFLKK